MRKFIIIPLILILLGCETITFNDILEEKYSSPDLGKETTKNVGDILLSQGTRNIFNGIEIYSDFPDGGVSKGLYKEIGTQQGSKIFDAIEDTGASIKGPNPEEYFLILDNLKLEIFTRNNTKNILNTKAVIPSDIYEEKTITIEKKDSFQQTLIYTGKIGNELHLTYREYSNEIIRSSFSLNLIYDLSISNIIAFQNARIEIIEADNISIKYKIINNFN